MMENRPERLGICPELNLSFCDLKYTVADKGGKQKEVLHAVSGQIKSGRLTAILGASGAGKTSLLNVLTATKSKGVSGSVLVNNKKRNIAEFRRQSCYITQDVAMLDVLTVEETLKVAAKLKLSNYTDCTGQIVVDEVMELLGLTKSRNTRVEKLSGGEQKRLSMGMELVTNPPIMFFDEPTSGLDSVSATQVVNHLRCLAKSGRSVACVIHQPSSKLCHMFDDIIIMSHGYILYSGPIDQMVPTFEEAGFPYPKDYNRADYALEVACGERGEDLSNLLEKFNPSYVDKRDDLPIKSITEETQMLSLELSSIAVVCKGNHVKVETTESNEDTQVTRKYATSYWRQFVIILHRSLVVTMRERYMTQMRLVVHILNGLLLGILCFNVGGEASKIFTNASNLFFFTMFTFFVTSMSSALLFPKEVQVLIRELMNNWYSLPTYFLAKCVANVPMQLLCPTIFIAIAYFMTGQPLDFTRFSITWLIIFLLGVLAQIMGMAFGALLGPELGIFTIPAFSVPLVLFSGYFVQLPDIPDSLRWLAEVSFFKHGFEAVVGVIYGRNRPNLHCSEPFCFFKYPTKFLEHLQVKEENLNYNISVLIIWIVVVHVLLYIVMAWRVRNTR